MLAEYANKQKSKYDEKINFGGMDRMRRSSFI